MPATEVRRAALVLKRIWLFSKTCVHNKMYEFCFAADFPVCTTLHFRFDEHKNRYSLLRFCVAVLAVGRFRLLYFIRYKGHDYVVHFEIVCREAHFIFKLVSWFTIIPFQERCITSGISFEFPNSWIYSRSTCIRRAYFKPATFWYVLYGLQQMCKNTFRLIKKFAL